MDEDCLKTDIVTSESGDDIVLPSDSVAVSNCKDENEIYKNDLSSTEFSHEPVSDWVSPHSEKHDADVIQSEIPSGGSVGTVVQREALPLQPCVEVKSTVDSFDQRTGGNLELRHHGPPQSTGNKDDNEVQSQPTSAAAEGSVSVDVDQLPTSVAADEIGLVDDEQRSQLSDNYQIAASDEPQVNNKPEKPKVNFTAGIRCSDVPTALDILNTRYRLVDVTIHKNMITWSSWNIADIVRGPHRESFCWVGKRRGRYSASQPSRSGDASADEGFVSSTHNEDGVDEDVTDGRLKDMESLCEKIELKEKEIERMLQRDEQRQLASAAEPLVTIEEPVAMDTVALTCAEAPPGGDNQKQRRENVFQRLLRALRQRFSRQSQECRNQEQEHGACKRSKQRTL